MKREKEEAVASEHTVLSLQCDKDDLAKASKVALKGVVLPTDTCKLFFSKTTVQDGSDPTIL